MEDARTYDEQWKDYCELVAACGHPVYMEMPVVAIEPEQPELDKIYPSSLWLLNFSEWVKVAYVSDLRREIGSDQMEFDLVFPNSKEFSRSMGHNRWRLRQQICKQDIYYEFHASIVHFNNGLVEFVFIKSPIGPERW